MFVKCSTREIEDLQKQNWALELALKRQKESEMVMVILRLKIHNIGILNINFVKF
jgi:hypothetical protein